MSKRDGDDWKPATKLVRGGTMRSQFGETSEAIFLTSGYAYDSAEQAAARMAGEEEGFVYSRYANPTVRMLEERLALLDGAEACRVTASGMGAISSAMIAPVGAGDRVVAASALFGSCRVICQTILPRYGVETEFVPGADLDAWKKALSRPAKLVLIESPSNPLLEAVDIEAVAELAHKAGAKLVVDNVFATPVLQRPFDLGADVCVYSATKHMDGQGRVLAGAILGKADWIEEFIDPWLRHTGPAASPFNAWVVLKGLETLDLRVREASRSAARIADAIAGHANVRAVHYPGRKDHPHHAIHAKQMSEGGTLIAFSVKGERAEAFRVLNALTLVDISNNLGDTKSLACHPASTTHRALNEEERASMGLDESWIRLSVGLEDAGDLEKDILAALDAM
ncbi:O-succinylhomoserine sulfhydrylase [Henriciella pelagia]|jgi:O-succinylhomoserine sulfhydrylase|uniref:O-succinylhomoserine sulfhydrylase n=1 Tax=Henriciella pelagia TaxID=1977912 RepID=A0ABQ1JUW4_9PROT|nr:O-succinylhomoserine sulfhydrylase [Henriciella pelagia]GGB75158.1 O-succinylhomoserine sulfhydrylase [Henriciella pelagia]